MYFLLVIGSITVVYKVVRYLLLAMSLIADVLSIIIVYSLERDTRIELVTKPWQGFEIPLHQSRILLFIAIFL